jgi:multiple sugar transport system substrate-binding protein
MNKRIGSLVVVAALAVASAAPVAAQDGDIELSLARFFGDCEDATQGVTDVSLATTECEVIEILTNEFNAMDNGTTVTKVGGQAWDDYYPQLSTTFAAGDPPDVAVMHGHRLPDFAGRGLLTPIAEGLADAGADYSDYTQPAQDAGTFDGVVYGAPFDLHALLFHVNVDLFEQAGLVDEAGNPILPSSPEEMLEHAAQFQEATGKLYFTHEWTSNMPVRTFQALIAQQGGSLYEDGAVTANTPEAAAALQLLFDLAQTSDIEHNYEASQAAFLNGDVGILNNGTWVVDQYGREVDFEYLATNWPTLYSTPAAWGDSHMWVLPNQPDEDPARTAAAVGFVKHLYDNIGNWAIGTGHIGPRVSIIESDAYQSAPQRSNYAATADSVALAPAVAGWAGAYDAMFDEVLATWLADKDQAQALADMEARMAEQLN